MIKNRTSRAILTALGYLCVALGVLGAFLPILPTTPFILLASWLFYHSSPKARRWLMSHRILGKIVENFMENKSIPLHAKIISISMIWLSIGSTIIFMDVHILIKLALLLIAIGTTIHISRFKTLRK